MTIKSGVRFQDKNRFENKMDLLFIGFHSSIGLGFFNSVKIVDKLGGNSVQIFLKSPRGRFSKTLDLDDAKLTKQFVEENNIFLIGHSSYLINLCKDFKQNSFAIESLIDDMQKISLLGGIGVVLHVGKKLDMEIEVAYSNLKKSLELVLDKTSNDVMILFENTSGQGTEIGFTIEELKLVYDLFDEKYKKRIGFCFDTAHGFAAGYDFSTKIGVDNFYAEFESKIGWNKLVCIHFNDSKKILGSKVDRHADIGYGEIGKEGLIEFTRICFKTGKPLILETPSDNIDYFEQMKLVKNSLK